MDGIIKQLPSKASAERKSHKALFKKLKRKPPKDLDYIMQELHDETFAEINCLECANCCKTTSPLFTDRDIQRISKFLKFIFSRFQKIISENFIFQISRNYF